MTSDSLTMDGEVDLDVVNDWLGMLLNDNWQTVGIVLASVVVAAVGYVAFRTDTDNPAAGIPADDASERSSVL